MYPMYPSLYISVVHACLKQASPPKNLARFPPHSHVSSQACQVVEWPTKPQEEGGGKRDGGKKKVGRERQTEREKQQDGEKAASPRLCAPDLQEHQY
jgi:hypothetical protein